MLRSSVAACGKDGCIKLWDLRSQGPSGLSGLSASTVSQEALFVWQITAALGCFYPKTSWCVLGFFKGQVCSRLATWRPWCCPVITGAPKLILYQKVSLLALWCRVFSRFPVNTEAQASPALWCSWRQAGVGRIAQGASSPNSNCNGSVYTWYTWYTFSFCIFMEHEMKNLKSMMINMAFTGKRRDRKIQWFTSRKAGAISSIDFHPTGEQLISAGEVRLTTIGCANFLQTLTPKVDKTEVLWEIMCAWLSRLEVIRFVVWWCCAATGWIANLESSWGSLDARGQTVLQLWMTKRYKKIQKSPLEHL